MNNNLFHLKLKSCSQGKRYYLMDQSRSILQPISAIIPLARNPGFKEEVS